MINERRSVLRGMLLAPLFWLVGKKASASVEPMPEPASPMPDKLPTVKPEPTFVHQLSVYDVDEGFRRLGDEHGLKDNPQMRMFIKNILLQAGLMEVGEVKRYGSYRKRIEAEIKAMDNPRYKDNVVVEEEWMK